MTDIDKLTQAAQARSLWVHDQDGPTETIHDKREAFGEDSEWTEYRAVLAASQPTPVVGAEVPLPEPRLLRQLRQRADPGPPYLIYGYTADQLRAYGDAREPAAGVAGWQPIETAPRGRILLVGYRNRAGKWRSVRGRYYNAETLECESSDDGWAPEGWYEEADNAEEINFTDGSPTYWQYMPPEPAAPTKEGEQA